MTEIITMKTKKNKKLIKLDGGFVRESKEDKVDFTLIPLDVLTRIARHYTDGAKIHGRNNWQKSKDMLTFKQSAFRHLVALLNNETDEPHAESLVWNIMCLMHHTKNENTKQN